MGVLLLKKRTGILLRQLFLCKFIESIVWSEGLRNDQTNISKKQVLHLMTIFQLMTIIRIMSNIEIGWIAPFLVHLIQLFHTLLSGPLPSGQ